MKTQHSGRIERHRPRSVKDPINQALFAWRQAYRSACRYDDIPEGAMFAVFSDDNPFVKFVDIAKRELDARRVEYVAGGYVGLQM